MGGSYNIFIYKAFTICDRNSNFPIIICRLVSLVSLADFVNLAIFMEYLCLFGV